VVFTLLTTLGTGLINHQLRNASGTYGNFGSVIGLVAFLLLLAKLSVYAAELNCVLDKKLYPRSFLPKSMAPAQRSPEPGADTTTEAVPAGASATTGDSQSKTPTSAATTPTAAPRAQTPGHPAES